MPTPDPRADVERLARGYWTSPNVVTSLALPARPPRSVRIMDNAGWDAVVDFVSARPAEMPALFAALVAAAPEHDRALPHLGTDLFETLHHDVGNRAMGLLRDAGLEPAEVKAILSGVWVSILREVLDDGEEIPLPPGDVAWLLDPDGKGRDKYW